MDEIGHIGTQQVRIESAPGVRLAGTLTLPTSSAPAPLVLGVHAASAGTRDYNVFRHLQDLLPEHGIATLFFDRRGEGESTGDRTEAGFEVLAADVLAWVRHIRYHPRIEDSQVGLWCISQGGWISALAAAEEPSIAFLIAVSPSGVTAAEQMKYAAAAQLREAGYTEAAVTEVNAIRERIDAFFRGQAAFEDALALFERARAEPWFELAWLPEPTSPPGRWRLQMDFDIRPTLARVRCPVLLIFGEWDRWVPIQASLENWQSALSPLADLTVARIAGAGHQPTLAVDRGDIDESGPIAPEYEELLVRWLNEHLLRGT